MQENQLLKALQTSSQFPAHGWARDSDGCSYLVFPLLRAIQSISQVSSTSGQPTFSSHVQFRDSFRAGHFQKMLHRILAVLSKIAENENTVRSEWPRDGISLEQMAAFQQAHQFLPIYVEMFFIYFRLIADRLAVALAPLASQAPASFPKEYGTLLNAADSGTEQLNWRWRVNPAAFLNAIRDHSDWYRLLVGPIGSSPKGIRDTINHRLVTMQPIRHGGDSGQSTLELHFEGLDQDIPRIELLSAVTQVVTGFCKLLSNLPVEIWTPQTFVGSDIAIASKGDWPAITQFFPQIL